MEIKQKEKKSKNKKRKNKVHGAVDATTVVIASDDESEEDESIEENKILDGYGELDDNKFYYVLDGVIMEMDLNDMSDEDEDENTDEKEKDENTDEKEKDEKTDEKEKDGNESTVPAEAIPTENVETYTSTTKGLGAAENSVDEEEAPTLVKFVSDSVKQKMFCSKLTKIAIKPPKLWSIKLLPKAQLRKTPFIR